MIRDPQLANLPATVSGIVGNVMYVVNHGSNANVTRPSPVGAVYWIGTVAPNNAVVADQWFDTTP